MNILEFGNFIKKQRKETGITKRKLPKDVGGTVRTIGYWENGQKEISLSNDDKLLRALGVSFNIEKQ